MEPKLLLLLLLLLTLIIIVVYILFRNEGHPRIGVDLEDIEFLSGLRFSYTDIAKILGVSHSTLYRRLEEEGITQYSKYSDISDNDLDKEICEIKLDPAKHDTCYTIFYHSWI